MIRFHQQPSDVEQPFIHALLCAHTALGAVSAVETDREGASLHEAYVLGRAERQPTNK